jgi:hypothetical protein
VMIGRLSGRREVRVFVWDDKPVIEIGTRRADVRD